MLEAFPHEIGLAVAFLVAVLAFLRGDEPERIGAGAYLMGLYAALLLQDHPAGDGAQWPLLAVDLAFLLVCAGLAWKSRRAWPVWACGLQLAAVMVHLLALVDRRPPAGASFTVINLASYGVLAAIVAGTLLAWRDRRAAAPETIDGVVE